MNIVASPPQPIDKTLNLEASLCLNGFKEAGFASVETEASQAYVSLKMGSLIKIHEVALVMNRKVFFHPHKDTTHTLQLIFFRDSSGV
ncbi:hypothetical protein YC2023_112380 [Brassica napus]